MISSGIDCLAVTIDRAYQFGLLNSEKLRILRIYTGVPGGGFGGLGALAAFVAWAGEDVVVEGLCYDGASSIHKPKQEGRHHVHHVQGIAGRGHRAI